MFTFNRRVGRARKSISVLVADPSGPWCDFMPVIFESLPEVRLVGIVSNGIDAVEKTQRLKPDFILLDVHLPGLSGLETVRNIRELRLKTKALIVTLVAEREIVKTALQDGVSAYIHKFDFGTEILAAMQATLQDKVYLSSEIQRLNT